MKKKKSMPEHANYWFIELVRILFGGFEIAVWGSVGSLCVCGVYAHVENLNFPIEIGILGCIASIAFGVLWCIGCLLSNLFAHPKSTKKKRASR